MLVLFLSCVIVLKTDLYVRFLENTRGYSLRQHSS